MSVIDKDNKDEPQKEEKISGSLDEVHDRTIQDLENEDVNEEDNKEDKDNAEEDISEDNKDGAKEKDAEENKDDPSDENIQNVEDFIKDEDDNSTTELDKEKDEPEELDTDSSKPSKNKIAVKGFDGKTYYFNNLDEVPEDFEPSSYKEWGRAVQRFTDKAQNDKKDEEERLAKQAEDEKVERLKTIKAGWKRDIDQLTESKALPEDEKERQEVIDKVFGLMNDELTKGRVLEFAPAYEIYQFRQGKDEVSKRKKEVDQEKKDKGSRVQGAGTGGGKAPKPKVIEGPPPGVSLDQVHEQVLGSL